MPLDQLKVPSLACLLAHAPHLQISWSEQSVTSSLPSRCSCHGIVAAARAALLVSILSQNSVSLSSMGKAVGCLSKSICAFTRAPSCASLMQGSVDRRAINIWKAHAWPGAMQGLGRAGWHLGPLASSQRLGALGPFHSQRPRRLSRQGCRAAPSQPSRGSSCPSLPCLHTRASALRSSAWRTTRYVLAHGSVAQAMPFVTASVSAKLNENGCFRCRMHCTQYCRGPAWMRSMHAALRCISRRHWSQLSPCRAMQPTDRLALDILQAAGIQSVCQMISLATRQQSVGMCRGRLPCSKALPCSTVS